MQEWQSRRGDGRRPSRAEQRLRSLFDAGDAKSPELGVEVNLTPLMHLCAWHVRTCRTLLHLPDMAACNDVMFSVASATAAAGLIAAADGVCVVPSADRTPYLPDQSTSPQHILQGRRRPARPASEGPRALQALLEAAGRDDSVRGPSGANAAPQNAGMRAAAAKR
jgi:hypothetical protein